MSDYNRCKICGEYDWLTKHICPPVWKIQIVDHHGEEEWEDVHAASAEYAAKKAAEQYDVDDHPLLEGGTITVRVQVGDAIEEYVCWGEAVPQYWVKKKETDSEN